MKDQGKKSIILLFVSSILVMLIKNCFADEASANRWDTYFKRKLFDPPAGFVVEALKFMPNNHKGKVAIDLGAGVGHETLVLLKNGFQVVAIDNQEAAFKYMKLQPEIKKYEHHLKPIVSSFEHLNFSTIPDADLVVASFSLPFVSQKDFDGIWAKTVSKIKPGGYFVGNLFDPDFTFFDQKFRPHMTFHTKSQALDLLKGFQIIHFKEVKLESVKNGKYNHYYVFLAKKIVQS